MRKLTISPHTAGCGMKFGNSAMIQGDSGGTAGNMTMQLGGACSADGADSGG